MAETTIVVEHNVGSVEHHKRTRPMVTGGRPGHVYTGEPLHKGISRSIFRMQQRRLRRIADGRYPW